VRYQFIAQHRHEYAITLMCRVLEVSVSGFSAWLKRPPSQHSREDAELAEQVKTVFQANRGVYGSPRVHADLQAQAMRCARKRLARLMREQELFAKRPRRRTVTPQSDPDAHMAPNILQREFRAEQPNPKWVADTTYIWTAEGWCRLTHKFAKRGRYASEEQKGEDMRQYFCLACFKSRISRSNAF